MRIFFIVLSTAIVCVSSPATAKPPSNDTVASESSDTKESCEAKRDFQEKIRCRKAVSSPVVTDTVYPDGKTVRKTVYPSGSWSIRVILPTKQAVIEEPKPEDDTEVSTIKVL